MQLPHTGPAGHRSCSNSTYRFLQAAGQIHNRHVGSGDAEGHASELPVDTRKQGQSALLLPAPWVHMAEQPRVLPVELRDDLAHGLGSASRSRDDILGSPSAVTPHLPGGAIHRLLGGSDGVDGGLRKEEGVKAPPGAQ